MYIHSLLKLINLVLHISYFNYAGTDSSFEECAKKCRKSEPNSTSDNEKDPERRPLRIGDYITPQDFYAVAKHLIQNGGSGTGIVSSASRPEELADNLFEEYFMTQRRVVRLKGLDLSGLDRLQDIALQNNNKSQSEYGNSEYCKNFELMSRKVDRAYLEYLKKMARRRAAGKKSSEYRISSIDNYHIFPIKNTYFSFKVRAYTDIYIALLPKAIETAWPKLEMIIGAQNNQVCYVKWNGRIENIIRQRGILNPTKFVNIIVGWDDKIIKAAIVGESKPFYEWRMDRDISVKFVGIKGRVRNSVWKIDESDDKNTPEPDPDPEPYSEETTTQMHRKTTSSSDETNAPEPEPDPEPYSEETTTQMHRKTTSQSDETNTPEPEPYSDETTTQMHRKTTKHSSDETNTPEPEPDPDPDPHPEETTTQMHRKATTTPSTDDDHSDPYHKWDVPKNIYIDERNRSTEYLKIIRPTGAGGFVIVFQILAAQDGYVMLTRTKFWIGVKIHLCTSGRISKIYVLGITETFADTGTCPNEQEYMGFWISWDGKRLISVGHEGNKEPFMTTTIKEGIILPLNYVIFGCQHYPCSWKIKGYNGKEIECQNHLPLKNWTAEEFMTSGKNYKIFPVYGKSISFKVLAARNAIIAMTTSPTLSNPMIEVTLGKNSNTITTIKKDNDTKTEITAETPRVLNSQDYVGFWITWKDNGLIEVGHEGDKDNFIHFENPEPFDIKYVIVRTLLSFGWWLINVNDSGYRSYIPSGIQLLADDYTETGRSQLDQDIKKILDDHASLIKKPEKNSVESMGSYFDRLIL